MEQKNELKREKHYELRAKAISIDNQIIDLNTQLNSDFLIKNLKSVEFVITAYETLTNIITVIPEEPEKDETVYEVMLSNELESILQPSFNTSDFTFKQIFENKNKCINHISNMFNNKSFSNKIDFSLFIDSYYTDEKYILTKNFSNFIFSTFSDNIKIEGNTSTDIYLSNLNISPTSLTINKTNIILDQINILDTTYFNISYSKISGLGTVYQKPDQFRIVSREFSYFNFIDIATSVRISIESKVESNYTWLNKSELQINYLNYSLLSNSDKDGKFDNILKLKNWNKIFIKSVNINNILDKLVPINIENCGSVDLYEYNNLIRPTDKGIPEIQIDSTPIINIIDLNIESKSENHKRSPVITINNIEDLGEVFLSNINITNVDLLAMANVSLSNLNISKATINSNQYVFNINGDDAIIEEIVLDHITINSTNFELLDRKNIIITDSDIDITENINISSFKMFIENTDIISRKNLYLSTANIMTDKEKGDISIKDSVLTGSSEVIISDTRNSTSVLNINNTRIKSNNIYKDLDFLKVSYNGARLESRQNMLFSLDYRFNACCILNNLFVQNQDSFYCKGNVAGSLELKCEENPTFNLYFEKEVYKPSEKDKLVLKYNTNNNPLNIKTIIKIKNFSLNILSESSFSDAIVNTEYNIIDESDEQWFYTTGNFLYISSNNKNFTHYLKNATAEKMKLVNQMNSASSEESFKLLNFGTKF